MINLKKILGVLAVATSVMLSNGPAMSYMKKDIVGTAVDAGSFTTLVTALKSAGLVDVLKGDGPFTVFAPTDEAFKALPKGTVADLLKPENKEKLIESAQELRKGLDLLSRDRKVVMPHNKAFDHVDKLKVKVDEIINLAETV